MMVCKLHFKVSVIFEKGRVVNVAQSFKEVSRKDLQPCEPALGKLTEDVIKDGISGYQDKCGLLET